MSKIEVRRALVSVYDKTGLDELARGLHEAGVEIVSTGSTAAGPAISGSSGGVFGTFSASMSLRSR